MALQIINGLLSAIPTLAVGEPAFCTDTQQLFIGSSGGNVLVSGLNLIADGGTLSGTYAGSVFCAGTATITGTLTIQGDLYCVNNLTNSGGFAVTIWGDLNAQNAVYFSPSSNSIEQGSVQIYGNVSINDEFQFWTNAISEVELTVGGDLYVQDTFDGSGAFDGASALVVFVGGNVVLDELQLNGSNTSSAINAGSGGLFVTYGDCVIYNGANLNGGSSYIDGYNCGGGGTIPVYGSLIASVIATGGSTSNNCSAGGGGEVYVYGTFTNMYTNLSGGNCSASSSQYSAGYGGYIGGGDEGYDTQGPAEITGDAPIYLNGGYRSGTLTDNSNTASAPNGGTLQCLGNIYASHVEVMGGNVATSYDSGSWSNSAGGSGGSITCKGSVILYYANVSGGSAYAQNGGNSGSITTKDRVTIEYQAYLNGGNSDTQTNGQAGIILAKGGLVADQLYVNDGTGGGLAPSGTCGVQAMGSVQIKQLNQVNRANSVIQPWPSYPAPMLLTISQMTGIQVLTNGNGSQTSNINSLLGTSIFSYSPVTGGWVVLTGTGI